MPTSLTPPLDRFAFSSQMYVNVQDPEHVLTGEGNASGTVDPKLAM